MNYFSWNAKNELHKYHYHSSILLWLKFRHGALQSLGVSVMPKMSALASHHF